MSSTQSILSQSWDDTVPTGVTTASLLVVLAVSIAMGALVGLALGGRVEAGILAMASGFVGTVVAGIVRNTLLVRAWGDYGVQDAGTPVGVIVYAALASFAGSLAADRIMLFAGAVPGVVLGAFAGLLSAILMGLLMLAYRMTPRAIVLEAE